MIYKLLDL